MYICRLAILGTLKPTIRRYGIEELLLVFFSYKGIEYISCFYPLTQMSDIFSPVKKASSSSTTSSVFHITTRSSYAFGFLGDMSTAGPGNGISMGNISTHISSLPCSIPGLSGLQMGRLSMCSGTIFKIIESNMFVKIRILSYTNVYRSKPLIKS